MMDARSMGFFGRLVAAHSASSKDPVLDNPNKEAAETVANMLEDAGFIVEMQKVPGLHGKFNVAASAGPDAHGEGLLLAGHTDTVPCTPQDWQTDPLVLTEIDGHLHGLGSCDMKGFFSVVEIALRGLDLKTLRSPLRVWATAEEECGMDGAIHIASSMPASAAALVGEPTALVPIYGHKGAIAERIVLRGKSGHSSMPAAGANALEAAAAVMASLRELTVADEANVVDENFDPPTPTLNFGMCRSGDAFNRIPDLAELWVDRRLMPDEDPEATRERIREAATKAASKVEGCGIEFHALVRGFPAALTPFGAPIVAEAARLTGRTPATVAYATEAPYYAKAGMDVLVMGAGDISVAHQPDERVPIAQLAEMAKVTRALVDRFCVNT